METLTLKIFGNSISTAKEFIKKLPPQEVEIISDQDVEEDYNHIPYVTKEEQAEIENILKNPESQVVSSKEKIFITI